MVSDNQDTNIVKKKTEDIELIEVPQREDVMLEITDIISYLKERLYNGRIKDIPNEKIRLENVRLQLKALKDLGDLIKATENSGLYKLLRELKEEQDKEKVVVEDTKNEEKLNMVLQQLIDIQNEEK